MANETGIVLGVGASHTTLMNTRWDEVDHLERAHEFRDGLAAAKQTLIEAALDLVVIVGSNHFRGFWLDLMPPFTVGVDAVTGVGEHGTPKGSLKVSPARALAIHQGLMERDFDIAMSTDLEVDHGITHAVQYLVPDGVPVMPLVINVFGPPLPSLARCLALGQALRASVLAAVPNSRVAIIGTGGLSHQIPFPDWRRATTSSEQFLAESFRYGRGRWEEYETKRRPLVVGAEPRLNEAFDVEFLQHLRTGTLPSFIGRLSNDDLVTLAGNGGNEVRAWAVMAAALDHLGATTTLYSPMPEWLTGMAVAIVDGRSGNQ